MDEKFIAELKELVKEKRWADDPDFMVDDYAGGNYDDAYQGGVTDGEVALARRVLAAIGQ